MQKRKQPPAEIFRRYHIKVKPVEIQRLDHVVAGCKHLYHEFLMHQDWSDSKDRAEVLEVLRKFKEIMVAQKDVEKYKVQILKQIERGKKNVK